MARGCRFDIGCRCGSDAPSPGKSGKRRSAGRVDLVLPAAGRRPATSRLDRRRRVLPVAGPARCARGRRRGGLRVEWLSLRRARAGRSRVLQSRAGRGRHGDRVSGRGPSPRPDPHACREPRVSTGAGEVPGTATSQRCRLCHGRRSACLLRSAVPADPQGRHRGDQDVPRWVGRAPVAGRRGRPRRRPRDRYRRMDASQSGDRRLAAVQVLAEPRGGGPLGQRHPALSGDPGPRAMGATAG